eukprot:g2999.t1
MYPRLLDLCDGDEISANFYLGWGMAAFSAGRGVSALLLNLRETTPRGFLLAGVFCFLCSGAGAVLWILAESAVVLTASRVVAGFGAGALSLMLQVLVKTSDGADRTVALSRFFVAAAFGEIVGPGLVVASAGLDLPLPDGFVLDQNNVAGLYTLVIFVVGFLAVLPAYTGKHAAGTVAGGGAGAGAEAGSGAGAGAGAGDVGNSMNDKANGVDDDDDDDDEAPRRDGSQRRASSTSSSVTDGNLSQPLLGSSSGDDGGKPGRRRRTTNGCCELISLNLVVTVGQAMMVNAGVAAWETVGIPLAQRHFGWDVSTNGIFFTISGALLMFPNVALVPVLVKLGLADRTGVIASLAASLAGAAMLVSPVGLSDEAVFVAGNVLYIVGIFCLLTLVTSLYTKELDTNAAAVVARRYGRGPDVGEAPPRLGLFIGGFRAIGAATRVAANVGASATLGTAVVNQTASAAATGAAAAAAVAAAAAGTAAANAAYDPSSIAPLWMLAAYPVAIVALGCISGQWCEREAWSCCSCCCGRGGGGGGGSGGSSSQHGLGYGHQGQDDEGSAGGGQLGFGGEESSV